MAALRASTPHIGSLSAPTVADLNAHHGNAGAPLQSHRTWFVFTRVAYCSCIAVTHHASVLEMHNADDEVVLIHNSALRVEHNLGAIQAECHPVQRVMPPVCMPHMLGIR